MQLANRWAGREGEREREKNGSSRTKTGRDPELRAFIPQILGPSSLADAFAREEKLRSVTRAKRILAGMSAA